MYERRAATDLWSGIGGDGAARLKDFDAGPWGEKYPAIAQSWRRNWEQVIPFFAFPAAVRRIIGQVPRLLEIRERDAGLIG